MALKTTTDLNDVRPWISSIAFKVGVANLIMGLAGFGVCTLIAPSHVPGFMAGFTIGVVSLYLSLRILRKGIRKGTDAAAWYVTSRYYVKFAATVTAFSLIIWRFDISPLGLVIGHSGTIFTTIGAIIVISRGEFQYA